MGIALGRLGRADARQRPRLRDPGAGAVEDRGGASCRSIRPPGTASWRWCWRPRRCARSSRGRAAAKADRRRRASPSTPARSVPRPPARGHRRRSSCPRIRRRLQGTLLTCSLYKRAPLANLTPGRRTPRSCSSPPRRRRSQGRRATTENLATAAARRSARRWTSTPTDRILCSVPLHAQLRLRLRPADLAGQRRHAVPRGRDLAEAHRQAAARADASISSPGNARAVRIAGARADGQAAQERQRALPQLGLGAAAVDRRELPAAVRRPPALLLPQHAGRAAGDRSRRQGSGDASGKPFEGVELRVAGPKRRPDLRRARRGRSGCARAALSMLSVPEDPPAQAR